MVLDRVDCRIVQGEIVALLGPSGCGKSTLLNLVAGIDEPDSGEVHIAGVALHRLSERERTLFRRRTIGFVFQFFNLLPTLTVEENLLLPLELKGRLTAADRERAHALLREVGLAERAGTFPDRLSGGEQQRVALARAIVHDPSLVLADEPTGNLDQETGVRILDLLVRLSRDADTTLVLVTHDPRVAARADRRLTIRAGHLEELPRSAPEAGTDSGVGGVPEAAG